MRFNLIKNRILLPCFFALNFVVSCSVSPQPKPQVSDEPFSLQKALDEQLYEKTGTPTNYEKEGVSFSYPSNWNIGGDEELKKGIRQIVINGNNMGGFIISLASPGFEFNQKKVIESMEDGLIKGVSSKGKIVRTGTKDVIRKIAGKEIKGIQETFMGQIANEKIMRNIELFFFDEDQYKVMVVFNTFYDEMERPNNGFQMILDSLKFNFKK